MFAGHCVKTQELRLLPPTSRNYAQGPCQSLVRKKDERRISHDNTARLEGTKAAHFCTACKYFSAL